MRHARSLLPVLGLVLAAAALPVLPAGAGAGPRVTAADLTVFEGVAAGRATVVLRLDSAAKRDVSVSWRTVDGTAKAGEDYRRRSGEVTFEPGQRKRTVRVPLLDDDVAEETERFSVRLRSARARVPGDDVRVTVRDDDGFSVQLASAAAVDHDFDQPVSGDDPTLRGGELSATAPDGTEYTLTVPDGALARETTITMTPWRSATGTGVSGGRLVGVRLEPGGTEFLRPLTLRIDPPGDDSLPAVTLTRADGTSHGHPADLDTDRLVLHLTHFSDFYGGIGDGISIEIVDPVPLDPTQQLAAEMERLLREERNRQLEGQEPDPDLGSKIEQLLTAYYDQVVAPKLHGIRTDCSQARAHTGQVIGFARQAALLGVLDAQQQTILDAAAAGAENCLEEALEPCVDREDAAQMREIFAYWRQVMLFGGTVPDPDPLDPSRECKDLLTGTLTITMDKELEVNGFRTEEHWTLVYQPRMVNPEQDQMWFDDGRGGWTVSGSYRQEDLRDGAACPVMSERTYSGSGTLHTTFHGQLDPSTDEGAGIAELQYFFPQYDGNLGMTPGFDGEVVGHSTRTTYHSTDGECVADTDELGHWFSPNWGPGFTEAPGTVVDSETLGRGVQFAYTFSRDDSDADTTDTYRVELAGSLAPSRG